MKANKEYILEELSKQTNYSESECVIISNILDEHFIIGHNNKIKIKNSFVEKLNITESAADMLYNTCAEIIVKGIFK